MLFGNKQDKVKKDIEKKNEKGLIDLAHDKDKAVRLAAIAGIGQVGTDDGFNQLVPMLAEPDADIRETAALALGKMGNIHARAHLSFHLKSEQDEKVRKAIQTALGEIRDDT